MHLIDSVWCQKEGGCGSHGASLESARRSAGWGWLAAVAAGTSETGWARSEELHKICKAVGTLTSETADECRVECVDVCKADDGLVGNPARLAIAADGVAVGGMVFIGGAHLAVAVVAVVSRVGR